MAAEEFTNQDLKGSRFTQVDLSESELRDLAMKDVRIVGAWIENMEIDGLIEGSLLVNEVDVVPYVEAELNKRHPGRETILGVRTGDADAFRDAMRVLDRVWPSTYERLRKLAPDQVHERVRGEWSAVENLRHLVLAIDAWANRALLGIESPYHPLGLPHSEMGEIEGVPNDPDARPSLDEVIAVHDERVAVVRRVIEELTDERLAGTTEPNTTVGYPEPNTYEVRRCLAACVIEEWEHRLFIERNLDLMGAG
jgi:hypothetical protein